MTLALDLGVAQDALAAAAGWSPPQHLPAERRSHFYIDIARAHAQTGRYDLCVDTLGTAKEIAPEHVNVHPHVRAVLGEVISSGNTAAASAARQFATATDAS